MDVYLHMGLFKSGDELLDKGYSLLKQKEFSKALSTFKKANEKLEKQGDKQNANITNALAKLLEIPSNENNPGVYIAATEALEPLGDTEIKFGIRTVKASDIAKECSLKAEELTATSRGGLNERADRLKQVGMNYQTLIGNSVLCIPEIFNDEKSTGSEVALLLFAISEEQHAEATVWSDPKKAAEYYQNAANWRRQIGHKDKESDDISMVKQYSKGAKCWICGREIYGEEIHFLHMPSEITTFQGKSEVDSLLPSMSESEDVVYVCRACYQAISKKADEIANHYHQIAMKEISRVESELNERINEVIDAINRMT